MKTNYSDSLIEKVLDKLNMTELLELDGNVPVRATKDITLAHIDVHIPKGTLFYITDLVWLYLPEDKSRFEWRFAFPDTDGVDDVRGWDRYYYLPCKINTNTYEIISCDGVSLTEMVERVDGETEEMMKALYFKHCEFNENLCKHDKKYSYILDVLKVLIIISLFGVLGFSLLALATSFLVGYIIMVAICGVIFLVSMITAAINYAMSDYEKSSDAIMLRTVMAELTKMIAEKEKLLGKDYI